MLVDQHKDYGGKASLRNLVWLPSHQHPVFRVDLYLVEVALQWRLFAFFIDEQAPDDKELVLLGA